MSAAGPPRDWRATLDGAGAILSEQRGRRVEVTIDREPAPKHWYQRWIARPAAHLTYTGIASVLAVVPAHEAADLKGLLFAVAGAGASAALAEVVNKGTKAAT